MFGYIKPFSPELKVSSFALYRSAYCGLCKISGKKVSYFSRFFLSYDYVFLAIVRLFLTKENYETRQARCSFKPYKKHSEMCENDALTLCAAAFALFTHYKIKDNISDSKGAKKVAFRLCAFLTAHFETKAKKLYPELKTIIDEPLERLKVLETKSDTTPDSAASTFGDMTAALISTGLSGERKCAAEKIGFQTGRFIYLCDALDDLEKDKKSGNFNPFLNRFSTADAARNYAVELKNSHSCGHA